MSSVKLRASRLAALLVAGTTMVAMAGCSPAGPSSGGASTDSTSSGPVTINWWSWNPDDHSGPMWVKAFEADHPNITVKQRFIQYSDYVNAVRLAATSNSGPDVFGLQVGALTNQFAPVTTDLTPLAAKGIGADWKDQLLQTDQLSANGKQVGLPWMITGSGLLWYNKTILDRVGVKPPTTLAEWQGACQKIQAAGITCFVQGAKDDWVNLDVYQAIVNQIDPGAFYSSIKGQGTGFDSAAFIKAFDVWKSLFDDGIVQKGALAMTEYPDANDQFSKGKAAMIALGTFSDGNMYKTQLASQAQTYGNQIKSQVFVPEAFPDVVGGAKETGRIFGGPDVGWAVSAKSQHQAAAFTLVQWLTTSKTAQQMMAATGNASALKAIPVSSSDLAAPTVQEPVLTDQTKQLNNLIGPRQIASADVQTALGQALSSVASGQMTSAAAAAAVQKAIAAAK